MSPRLVAARAARARAWWCIQWQIHFVLSGDNFAAEMEEECGAAKIFVVRSNGAGYGFSRPSSASSTSTEPAADVPPSSPSASPSSPPLPLGDQSAVLAPPPHAVAQPPPQCATVYDYAVCI